MSLSWFLAARKWPVLLAFATTVALVTMVDTKLPLPNLLTGAFGGLPVTDLASSLYGTILAAAWKPATTQLEAGANRPLWALDLGLMALIMTPAGLAGLVLHLAGSSSHAAELLTSALIALGVTAAGLTFLPHGAASSIAPAYCIASALLAPAHGNLAWWAWPIDGVSPVRLGVTAALAAVTVAVFVAQRTKPGRLRVKFPTTTS